MSYEALLIALCVWREARGEIYEAKVAVSWCIRNRASKPGWWGTDIYSVITKPFQFSSFNAGDPNSTKFPAPDDAAWRDCLKTNSEVLDPTNGATYYFDRSLDGNPPRWAASMEHVANIGNLRFFKSA